MIRDEIVNHQQMLKEKADPITLRELVAKYLEFRDVHPRTVKLYENTVRLAEKWLGRRCLARDFFTDEGLSRFVKYLSNSRIRKGSSATHRSPNTVNALRYHIVMWWSWAFHQTQRNGRNWAHVMPPDCYDVPKKRVTRSPPVAWTPGDVGEMLLHCDAGRVYNTWTTRHWRCLILMAYETGWRIGTLMKLRWSFLDGDKIRFEEPAKHKTDAKIISPDLQLELRQLPQSSSLIFPWPKSMVWLWNCMKEIVVASGLHERTTDMRKHLFHKFRRTHATQIAKATTIDHAAAALCHSDRKTAIQSYIDPLQLHGHVQMPKPE